MTQAVEPNLPSDAPAETDVYHVQPRPVWEAAREDYLRGSSSTEVCRRYGLSRSTLHARAAREGWRRSDQPMREVGPYINLTGDLEEASFFDLSEMAVMRLRRAILSGRAQEAAGWLAMVRQLRHESTYHDPTFDWDDEPGLPGQPGPVQGSPAQPENPP